ncbi:MAG: GAF domain-containing protein, partial [Myxococcales bacterium]|nr:GAF domain-containing protein [Myxococcales bacterium]
RNAPSRIEGARLRYLALVGGLAATFTMADYLRYVGLDIPPVGTVLTLIFLYVLYQSILRYRLLDLYELAGRLAVLTALSFTLAFIFWVSVRVSGGGFFLPSVVAAMVVLLLFDPVRTKVEEQISSLIFRERFDFERAVASLRRRVGRVLEIDDLAHAILDGLEQSRRVTHASLYFVDREEKGYNLAGSLGPTPVQRIEIAPGRAFLDRLRRDDHIVLETVERELEELRGAGDDLEAETLYEIMQSLEAAHASVCLAIRAESGEIYGLLCLRDERLRDAFSPEEVQLLRGLTAQASLAVENSRLYQHIKERDRLAALGEMAAGLAHEIRNPLGAIKASAQFLHGPDAERDERAVEEFLGIIIDEVDRLNRVLSSFLDFARPSRGNPSAADMNATVERTMQLLGPECEAANVQVALDLHPDTPNVRIDVEQLRQVLINLVRNAVQAMERGGTLTVSTQLRARRDVDGASRRWAEMRVGDTGPGIPQKIMSTLFVPFVTTKDSGTGLGLSISHRIVTTAGGSIDARNEAGSGATFVVRLPATEDAVAQRTGAAPASAGATEGAASGAVSEGKSESRSGADTESVRTANR